MTERRERAERPEMTERRDRIERWEISEQPVEVGRLLARVWGAVKASRVTWGTALAVEPGAREDLAALRASQVTWESRATGNDFRNIAGFRHLRMSRYSSNRVDTIGEIGRNQQEQCPLPELPV